jgi:hypothetical protein
MIGLLSWISTQINPSWQVVVKMSVLDAPGAGSTPVGGGDRKNMRSGSMCDLWLIRGGRRYEHTSRSCHSLD